MEEFATSDDCLPLNLLAWKIAFRSQSVQYIQSLKSVMLKGCLSISGEERTILQQIDKTLETLATAKKNFWQTRAKISKFTSAAAQKSV